MKQKMRFQVFTKPPLLPKVKESLAAFVAKILRQGHIHRWEILHGTSRFNKTYGLNKQLIIDMTSDYHKLIKEAMIAKFTRLQQQGFVSYWKISTENLQEQETSYRHIELERFPPKQRKETTSHEKPKPPKPPKPEEKDDFKCPCVPKNKPMPCNKEGHCIFEKKCPCVPMDEHGNLKRLKPCQKVPYCIYTHKEKKSKPKKYLSSNEVFWLDPGELEKLQEEFEVIFV